MRKVLVSLLLLARLLLPVPVAAAPQLAPSPQDRIAALIAPPMELGEALSDNGVYQLLNSGGALAGYVFETGPLAPLPGFSGAAINMLVVLDLNGRFIEVRLLDHNEPIFVSGLGQAPFHAFFEQYRGLSIADPMVVGNAYGAGGAGSDLVYLDGVTKATASVRIAHESIMAATLQVARERMQGIASGPPAAPDPDHDEALTWADLVAQGLAVNRRVSNAQVDALFAGTVFADDDPDAKADPDGAFLDLWLVDIGPPAIARAVLDPATLAELQAFQRISPDDEALLVIDSGRHGLVSADFVRNTAPDRLTAEQNGLPVALRDADLLVGLGEGVPAALHDGTAMILRADRRLGFNPVADWVLNVQVIREHGMFQPELGSQHIAVDYVSDPRFFRQTQAIQTLPPWREALLNRQADVILLAAGLAALLPVLLLRQSWLAGLPRYTPVRLVILAVVLGFVGWWGQGQLSIVTPLAMGRALIDGGSLGFLLYDPFSLLVWAAAVIGFVLWGRGLFCGWLCPFGALQEFAHHIGRALRLPRIEPSARWDARLKSLKYAALAGLVATMLIAPGHLDKAAEIEPFKTAITTFFIRDWYYVAYAALWLVLGLFTFKGFCRYLCPLGALMAIGGLLRGRDWIARRAECGSPCQLCRVRCNYAAIRKTGEINYSECFQCLDCVTIHDDARRCVPLVLASRRRAMPIPEAAE
ncbi:4Fe-4S binding protein [Paracoccus sp. M683]|uniref:4Fe-4S binding protein n=1 Tax=Paracoccus sp. M683 TaxID=2594268 RepID=UPI00117E3AE3|nr:4Fe-4S binding protein [Paracoccus sp. M683]TRW99668.1 4Fe-4S binding protein [Paracoccus sp. M683]